MPTSYLVLKDDPNFGYGLGQWFVFLKALLNNLMTNLSYSIMRVCYSIYGGTVFF